MAIPHGVRVIVVGYPEVSYVRDISPQVYFASSGDVHSKSDIPDGVEFICMGPGLSSGQKEQIRNSAASKGVRIEDVPEELLAARLGRFNGASREGGKPFHRHEGPPFVLVIGAESTHIDQWHQAQGVQFLHEGGVKSLGDIQPSIRKVFLVKGDDNHKRLILNLARSRGIPVGRFERRPDLLSELDRAIEQYRSRTETQVLEPMLDVSPVEPDLTGTIKQLVAQTDTDFSVPPAELARRMLPAAVRIRPTTHVNSLAAAISLHRKSMAGSASSSSAQKSASTQPPEPKTDRRVDQNGDVARLLQQIRDLLIALADFLDHEKSRLVIENDKLRAQVSRLELEAVDLRAKLLRMQQRFAEITRLSQDNA
ncbi:MAG: hypothetical protein HY395_00565 [Candidatus Doudnabacteria bacterium]|nr:hypothetical protein [Candidatus Doudnabacteria bacterium]